MKLVFSLLPEDIRQRRKEIAETAKRLFPDFPLDLDKGQGRLTLTVPDHANRLEIGDRLCAALSEIGVIAKPCVGNAGYVPPISMKFKQKRQVPLSVFITSLIAAVLAVFVLTFSLTGGFAALLTESTLGTGEQEGEDYADKISLVDQIFEVYSLYDTDGKLLLDSMLKAYAVASGDRYAMYYTEEEYNALMSDNTGNAVGIGIMVETDVTEERLTIVRVIPGSPAEAAGILPGDVVTHVGAGESKAAVAEIGAVEASNRMTGEAGTAAEFTVLRDGEEIPFSVTRAAIKTVSAELEVSVTDPTVGIINIYEFNTETPTQFKEAMAALAERGCTKVIFDVRDNPGGDLNSICAVLSYFLEEGQTILSTVQKDGTTSTYAVEEVTLEGDYASCSVSREEIGMYRSYIGSMSVLTSGYTASAAELFTAALKDYGLARVVGDTTYGKGIIQSIIPLDNWGYEGAVKLTVGYYNPPVSGNYDGVGITPDVAVVLDGEAEGVSLYILPEDKDAQLKAAIADLNTN